MMPQYKAIMMDVDGTLSNYSLTDLPLMPTQPVINAIKHAKSKFFIGVATSRPLVKMKPILEEVGFNCYCILHNGAQIIDPITFKTIWKKSINHSALHLLYEIAKNHNIQAYFSNFENNVALNSYDQLSTSSVADVFFDGVDFQIFETINSELARVPDIAVHQLSSRWENKYELSITHRGATKESAIFEVAKLLNISSNEIVGIGDALNDIPLLKACGYKVAMGNAVNEVKSIADLVAPSVQDDGIKYIIEKLILEKKY